MVLAALVLFGLPSVLPVGVSAGPASVATSSGLRVAQVTPGSDYPMYLGNVERSSAADPDPFINVSTASHLHLQWAFDANGWQVQSQPVELNGVVYVGGRSGYEYALSAANGSVLWKTFLGQDDNDSGCPASFDYGVTSTASVVNGTVYVGGGWPNLYALNATTGAVEWSTPLGGSATLGYYDWSSPLIYQGDAYIGTASACVHPLVAAGFAKYSLATHQLVGFYNTSAPNPNGSSIWGSPAVNPATGTLFVATGNSFALHPTGGAESVLSFNASHFTLQSQFQVPVSEVIPDGDFGVTTTLFTPAGGPPMLTAANKNGLLYALDQSNLSLVWEHRLCCSNGFETEHISTSFGGGLVYAVGSNSTVNGTLVNSTVTAFAPLTGEVVWQRAFANLSSDYGYAAPLYVNGLLVVGDDGTLMVLNAATGATLYQYATPGVFVAAPSVARGEILAGSSDDDVYAFTLPLNATAATMGGSGRTQTFAVSPAGGLPPYTFVWNFGDGTTSTAQDPIHTYAGAGTYRVTVTVADQTGNSSVRVLQVVVTEVGPAGLTALDFEAIGLAIAVAVPVALVVLVVRRKRSGAGPGAPPS